MAFIDLAGLQFAHYLLLGGGALGLLLLLLYALPGVRSSGLRVPAIVVVGLSGLAVGAGAGILLMAAFGYYVAPPEPPPDRAAVMKAPPPPPGMVPGKGGFGGKGGGGKGGKGPSARSQLASLVTKLDQLTSGALQLNLNDKEKVAVREQLLGLADKETLEDADARQCLDKVLEALKDHREMLEAAGYRFPGQGGGFGGGDSPNPFREEKTGQRLRALESRLGGKV